MQHFNVDYYNLPPRELQQAAEWLRGIAADAELKAQRLDSLRKQKERQERYMIELNKTADYFDTHGFENIDHENQINIIVQRLGCNHRRAGKILDTIKQRIKKRQIKRRNTNIVDNYLAGKDATENARLTGVTRQTVHTVLNEAKKKKLL